MIKPLRTLALALIAASLTTSCLNDTDTTDVTISEETAVTAFTLGTLKREMHTTSSKGQDSIYYKSVNLASTAFVIDEVGRTIYNPDSLPMGTVTGKALITVSTKNGTTATIKSLTSDSLTFISSSDSLDFSVPREIRVYGGSGSNYRAYTVTLNVHQEDGDAFAWTAAPALPASADAQAIKAAATSQDLFVAIARGASTAIYRKTDTGWEDISMTNNAAFPADAAATFTATADSIYIVSGGKLLSSHTGSVWKESADIPTAYTQTIGATADAIYLLNPGTAIARYSPKTGTLTPQTIDSDIIPRSVIGCAAIPITTNDETDYFTIIGKTETETAIWGHVEEYTSAMSNNLWVNLSESSTRRLPAEEITGMARLGNTLVALVGNTAYTSTDKGINWTKDTTRDLPTEAVTGTVHTMTTGPAGQLWVFSATSGQVWKGRLNRLNWTRQ